MIRVFYGNDRAKIAAEVKKILGENYEVFDGENLQVADLFNIFMGTTLFSEKRKILVKDLTPARAAAGEETSENAGVDFYEKIAEFVDTPHEIVIWETTVSQKKSYKDFVKNPKVVAQKFEPVVKTDPRKVFDIFDTALVDGPRAVKLLEEIEAEQDPYMFFGLLASQAIKKYEWRQGAKEKRVLKELSKLDMQMKTTTFSPWQLLESFLLRVSSL